MYITVLILNERIFSFQTSEGCVIQQRKF